MVMACGPDGNRRHLGPHGCREGGKVRADPVSDPPFHTGRDIFGSVVLCRPGRLRKSPRGTETQAVRSHVASVILLVARLTHVTLDRPGREFRPVSLWAF